MDTLLNIDISEADMIDLSAAITVQLKVFNQWLHHKKQVGARIALLYLSYPHT